MRTGKELILASKAFEEEDPVRSRRELLLTLGLLAAATALALFAPHWGARLAAGWLAGLGQFRLYALYHEHMHGAILRRVRWADRLMSAVGFYVLAVRSVWRETHDFHHQNNGKLEFTAIGSYPVMSAEAYAEATPAARRRYRRLRHPLRIALGYFTTSMAGMCIEAFRRRPKRHWGGPVALLLHLAVLALLVMAFDPLTAFAAWVLPSMLNLAMASYLFYAQHNFPGTRFAPAREWDYVQMALEGSSMFEMGPVMSWFTANIGYHHVHHLNHKIPFYRLPEAMRAMPELQQPHRTSWAPRDVWACLRLSLWDPELQRMR